MNKPYCYPGDISSLVEMVKKKTLTKHRWLKGHSMDWVWGQVWEIWRFHRGAIAMPQKAAGRICGQQRDGWCSDLGPPHLQYTGQWLGGGLN